MNSDLKVSLARIPPTFAAAFITTSGFILSRTFFVSVKEKRLASFEEDIQHWNDYDYILVNKNLDVCFKQIEQIILNNKKNSISSLATQ